MPTEPVTPEQSEEEKQIDELLDFLADELLEMIIKPK